MQLVAFCHELVVVQNQLAFEFAAWVWADRHAVDEHRRSRPIDVRILENEVARVHGKHEKSLKVNMHANECDLLIPDVRERDKHVVVIERLPNVYTLINDAYFLSPNSVSPESFSPRSAGASPSSHSRRARRA